MDGEVTVEFSCPRANERTAVLCNSSKLGGYMPPQWVNLPAVWHDGSSFLPEFSPPQMVAAAPCGRLNRVGLPVTRIIRVLA